MLESLSEAYRRLNEMLFEGRLPDPELSVQGRESFVLAFKTPNRIVVGGGCRDASLSQALDELVHCMIHIDHDRSGINDHTANQYHNLKFRDAAIDFGFYVVCRKSRGWCELRSRSSDIQSFGEGECVRPSREENARLVRVLSKAVEGMDLTAELSQQVRRTKALNVPRQTQLKYVCKCPSPHNSIRSGRHPEGKHPLDVTCNACGSKFELHKL